MPSISSSSSSWPTTLREVYLEPFLPPPIIQSIRTLDDTIHIYTGIPEATISISITYFVAWMIYIVMTAWFPMSHSTGTHHSRRRALKDDTNTDSFDNEKKKKTQQQYDATVLLVGPRNSGKTRLLYQFLNHNITSRSGGDATAATASPGTVMSLQTNVVYITTIPSSNTSNSNSGSIEPQQQGDNDHDASNHPLPAPPSPPQIIRWIDYPGHASLYDTSLLQILTPTTTKTPHQKRKSTLSPPPPLRIVLMVDATQPVTTAAELLFQLFTILYEARGIYDPTLTNPSIPSKPCIFVACHKKDIHKAKNEKRIKIQIRTELERLIYHHSVLQTTTTVTTASNSNSRTTSHNNDHKHQNENSSGSSGNATTSRGWWCCPPSRGNHQAALTSSHTTTTNINPFTIAVDLDELPFVQLYFYATTCCDATISRELYEFCTTGTVTSSSS